MPPLNRIPAREQPQDCPGSRSGRKTRSGEYEIVRVAIPVSVHQSVPTTRQHIDLRLTVADASAIGGNEHFEKRFRISHFLRTEFKAAGKALEDLPPSCGPHIRGELLSPQQ